MKPDPKTTPPPPAAADPHQLALFETTPAKLARLSAFAQDVSKKAEAHNRREAQTRLSAAQICWLAALRAGKDPVEAIGSEAAIRPAKPRTYKRRGGR